MSAEAPPPPEAWAPRDDLRAVYAAVCTSYHAIDDFRMKLLGLLPVATATGVIVLLSSKASLLGTTKAQDVRDAMAAIGAIGLLFTLGLFAFEIYGIKKCHYLIEAGRRLERDIGVRGQFRTRPFDAAGFLNEPVASALIYPSSMAAWLFLGIGFYSLPVAAFVAAVVALGGCFITARKLRGFQETHDAEERILQTLRREPASLGTLVRATRCDEAFVREALRRLRSRGDVEETVNGYGIARREFPTSALDARAQGWYAGT